MYCRLRTLALKFSRYNQRIDHKRYKFQGRVAILRSPEYHSLLGRWAHRSKAALEVTGTSPSVSTSKP